MAYTFPNSVPSGVNITPYVSGTDSIGTPASPFLSGSTTGSKVTVTYGSLDLIELSLS
jgi:hypothetical protein